MAWLYDGFQNVDIGGAEFFVGGRYLGLNRGECKAAWETEKVEVYQGVPRKLQGQIITQRKGTVSIEALELTPDNYCLASGDGIVVEVPGTTSDVPFDDYCRLAQPYQLSHDNVTGSSIVVKSSDGNTTYTEDTDYTKSASGNTYVITRKETGSITTSTDLKVSYTYSHTSPSTFHLVFGASSELEEIDNIVIHKKNDRNGMDLIIQIWKAQSDGAMEFIMNQDAGDVLGINLNFSILDDSEHHPDCPMGLISWQEGFDIHNLPTYGTSQQPPAGNASESPAQGDSSNDSTEGEGE